MLYINVIYQCYTQYVRYQCYISMLLGYEPAGLTVHPPPPRMIEGGFIFLVRVFSSTKNFFLKKS